MTKLSIIIPVLNEGKNIAKLVEEIKKEKGGRRRKDRRAARSERKRRRGKRHSWSVAE